MAESDIPKAAPEAAATAAPRGAFFGGGDRRTHLEQLRHLSQWSRRVLLVTGPRGVGKSALYRQLSATLEPRAKAARINGTLVQTDREVLHAVVQGFGLAAPVDGDPDVVRDVIVEHARAQERSDRFCVVLVDDAELLETRALEYLIALAADSPLRLVLFGEVRLVPAVERFAEPPRVGWFEIRLTGFQLEDVRRYLLWRLQEQGLEGALPFSESQIKEIARLSAGLPGRIDQMANVLLARIQSAGHGPAGRHFPTLHRSVLAVLAVALGIAYLWWRPGGEPEGDGRTRPGVQVEPLEIARDRGRGTPETGPPSAREQATADAGATGRDPARGAAPDELIVRKSAPEAEPDPARDRQAAAVRPAERDVDSPSEATVTDDAANGDAEAGSAEVESAGAEAESIATAAESADGRADTANADAEAETGSAAPPDAAEVAAAEPPAKQAPAASARAESRSPARTEPSAGTAPAEQSPGTAQAKPPAESASASSATAGVHDASWIMQQPTDAFTLQLVSFSSAERADAYLARQADPDRFARFRLQRDGRVLHVVMFGRFDSRAAAEQAATELPDSLGGVKPWVRSYGQIQDGVRTALQ